MKHIAFAALFFITACAVNVDTMNVTSNILQNTQWKLISVNGERSKVGASLEIDSNNSVSGYSGCNRFFGQSELKDNRFQVKQMGVSKMACLDEDRMKTEQIFINVLSNWSDISVEKNYLTLETAQYSLKYEAVTER